MGTNKKEQNGGVLFELTQNVTSSCDNYKEKSEASEMKKSVKKFDVRESGSPHMVPIPGYHDVLC